LENVDVDKLKKLKIPIIIQDYKGRMNKIYNMTGDYFKTGEMAAEFFLKRGFTNFAYYGSNDMVWSRGRADGFRSRIEALGYSLSILNNDFEKHERWSFNPTTLSAWLLSLPKPIALFACDDDYAARVTETCKINNIPVPEEIAVLGVDNDELICNISDPPLSSIVLDVEKGGYKVAALLHRLMNKELMGTYQTMIHPLRIELRKSTEKFVIADKYILRVIEFIRNNYDKDISINDVMRKVPLSRGILEKRFKKEVGTPIYQYLLQYRIDRFSDFLIKTDKPLSELALACGFNEYKNIARVFRKYKNMTPQQYRNLYSESKKFQY
jgi:LacI family transcriptional regulator